METGIDVEREVDAHFIKYKEEPSKFFQVQPDANYSLLWHFLLKDIGDPCSGIYYGTLQFPELFPNEPPQVTFYTPNGRFAIDTKLDVCPLEEWLQHKSLTKFLDKLVDYMKNGVSPSLVKGALDNVSHTTLLAMSESSIHQSKEHLKIFSTINSEVISPRKNLSASQSHDFLETINVQLREIVSQLCHTENPVLPLVILKEPTSLIKDGLPVVRLGIDFSNWKFIKAENWPGMNVEARRNGITNLVVTLLDRLMNFGHSNQQRFMFVYLNFTNTEVSMRSVFNGSCGGRVVHREVEVEVLNLSKTRTSPQALESLFRLRNLKELYLDHCEAIIQHGRQAFSLLSKEDPIPNLELLSVIGTSSILSHKWLEEIQAVCPKLSKIYFTRKKGTKALGWTDIVLMQTMRTPVLLPCGHIGDKASLRQLRYCSFDRQSFINSELLELNPVISYLVKDPQLRDKWTVQIVDFERAPLDAKVLYHECGCFFNLSTLKKTWDIKEDSINDAVIEKVKRFPCDYCAGTMTTVRLCYPHSAEQSPQDQDFEDLQKISAYSMVMNSRIDQ